MVVSAGLISGPSVGGFLISHGGWPWIFLVNIPFGIAGWWLVRHSVKPDMRQDQPDGQKTNFDGVGAVLQCLFLVSFMALVDPPLISVSGSAPVLVPRAILTVISLALLGVFVQVERERRSPLVDLSLMTIPTYGLGNLAGFFLSAAFGAPMILIPFYLDEVLRYSPTQIGIAMTAVPITVLFVAPVSGRLADRFGSKWLALVGSGIATLALLSMSGAFGPGLTDATEPGSLILAMAAMGTASGLFQSPNNAAIMGAVPAAKLGIASALMATVRNLGLASGTGLSTGLFWWKRGMGEGFTHSLHVALWASAIVALAAVFATFLRAERRPASGMES